MAKTVNRKKSIQDIMSDVAESFGMDIADMDISRRDRAAAGARQRVMYLAYSEGYARPDIARALRCDAATVYRGIEAYRRELRLLGAAPTISVMIDHAHGRYPSAAERQKAMRTAEAKVRDQFGEEFAPRFLSIKYGSGSINALFSVVKSC